MNQTDFHRLLPRPGRCHWGGQKPHAVSSAASAQLAGLRPVCEPQIVCSIKKMQCVFQKRMSSMELGASEERLAHGLTYTGLVGWNIELEKTQLLSSSPRPSARIRNEQPLSPM